MRGSGPPSEAVTIEKDRVLPLELNCSELTMSVPWHGAGLVDTKEFNSNEESWHTDTIIREHKVQ